MNGDKIYCTHCKQYSNETRPLFDSRQGGRPIYTAPRKQHFEFRCPHCYSTDLINVTMTIEQGIKDIITLNSKYYYMFIDKWPLIHQKTLNRLS